MTIILSACDIVKTKENSVREALRLKALNKRACSPVALRGAEFKKRRKC